MARAAKGTKRDFSLRTPTGSRERTGKKRRGHAAVEMTVCEGKPLAFIRCG